MPRFVDISRALALGALVEASSPRNSEPRADDSGLPPKVWRAGLNERDDHQISAWDTKHWGSPPQLRRPSLMFETILKILALTTSRQHPSQFTIINRV